MKSAMRHLAFAAILFSLPMVVAAQTAKEAFTQKARSIVGPEYSALLAVNCKVRDVAWYSDIKKAVERAYFYAAQQANISKLDAADVRLSIDKQLMPATNANGQTCPLLFMDSTLSDLDQLVLLNRQRP